MISEYVVFIEFGLLILDIFCALILLYYVLKGLKKGFLRNAFTLGLVLFFIFLLTTCAKPTIKLAISFPLPFEFDVYSDNVTIQSIVEAYVIDGAFDKNYMDYLNSGLSPVITDIIVSVVSWVVFSVFIFFSYILFMPIITLICKAFFPFLRAKEDGKKKRYSLLSKLLGLGCSLCQFFIFMFIFIVPFYGVIETGQIILNEASTADHEIALLSKDINEGVKNSVVLKLTSNIGRSKNGTFGVGAKTVGDRFMIQIDKTSINLIKEIDEFGIYLPRSIELSTQLTESNDANEMVACLKDEDITSIITWLADSKIIKALYPIAINLLEQSANGDEEIAKLGIDFKALANIDINKDIATLEPFFIGVLHCAKKVDLENPDYMTILRNEDLINEALQTIDIIFDLEITDKVVLNIAINYLNEKLKEFKLENLQQLVNNDYIKNNLINDISELYEIFKILDNQKLIELIINDDLTQIELTPSLKNDLEEILNIIFDLQLIKNHEQIIIQTVFTFIDTDNPLLDEMVNENINWQEELNITKQLVLKAFELMIEIDFESDDYFALLKKETTPEIIEEMIDLALQMQLTDKYIVPLIIDYLNEFFTKNDLENFTGIIDKNYLKNDLAKDLKKLVDAYNYLDDSNILKYFDETTKADFKFNQDTKTNLQKLANQLLSLKLIEKNEQLLIEYLATFIPQELIDEWNLDVDALVKENINWTNETKILVEVLIDAFEFVSTTNFNVDDLSNILKEPELKTLLPTMIDKIFTLQISEKYIAPILVDYITKMLENSGLSDMSDFVSVLYLKNYFSKDIEQIIELYQLLEELNLEDAFNNNENFKIQLEDQEKFRTFLEKLLNLYILDNHESELVIKLCNLANLDSFVKYDENDFKNVDWNEETTNFIDVIMAVINLTEIQNLDQNFLKNENFDVVSKQLADVFDALIKCSFTRNIAFNFIESLTNSIGYTSITLSDKDKENVIINTGKKEFMTLATLAKDILDLFPDENNDDYTTLEGSAISNLMKDASKGVIASKIMGTLLNEILGEKGLNIMPKDESGNIKYDFSDQQTLEEQADNIGNCIDLVNNLQSFDSNDINSISNVVSSLKALDNTDDNIVTDLLTEFLPTDASEVADDVNWNEEADLLDQVLTSYNESEDKENFTVDEKLQQDIDDSSFVGTILEYLNIFG